MLRQNTRTTTISILLLILLTIGGTGCYQQAEEYASGESDKPFYSARVATVRILMRENDWKATLRDPMAEEYVKADFWFDDEPVPNVAVRPKGNSSLRSVGRSGSSRFSLKVDFNFFNSAHNFHGLKKINLNNGFSDPTLIREVLSYDLFEQMGLPTPRNSFVDLWVNDTHLGLYTMVEQVDRTFLSNNFADSTGNLYKPEMPAAYLNWTESDLQEQQNGQATAEQGDINSNPDVNLGGGKLHEITRALEQGEQGNTLSGDTSEEDMPQRDMWPGGGMRPPGGPPGFPGMPGQQQGNFLKQMGLKTNENNPDHSALFKLLEVLNNEPDETFPEEIERVLDVDQVLRYLAVSSVLVHLDNYIGMGHNYYLYEVDGKFTIIPWDLNMSFGGFSLGVDRERVIDFYIDEPTIGAVADRPLVARLLAVPSYKDTYHEYLEELINGPFSPEIMEVKIDELANMIRPYVEADTLKLYSTAAFEKGLSEDIATATRMRGMGMNIGLKAFVAQRVESIGKQLKGELPSKSSDGSGNGGDLGSRWFPGMADTRQINPQTSEGGNQ